MGNRTQRLDQLVARNLACPRERARRLIRRGELRDAEGRPFDRDRLRIANDELPLAVRWGDRRLTLVDEIHFLQHKPRGVVTSLRDPVHPTAHAMLADRPLAAELRAVGRLDLDCSGLLLWTTRGEWVHRLTHPKRGIERSYHVALARDLTARIGPIELRDGTVAHVAAMEPLGPGKSHPALEARDDAQAHASITLTSGHYHEVKRIFAALGNHVLALARVRHARIDLPRDLAPGDAIAIDLPELAATDEERAPTQRAEERAQSGLLHLGRE